MRLKQVRDVIPNSNSDLFRLMQNGNNLTPVQKARSRSRLLYMLNYHRVWAPATSPAGTLKAMHAAGPMRNLPT
jgi:hypothetical protein